MINYEPFWQMTKARGISTYWLRKNGVGAPVVTKLQQGGNIDTKTINKLCSLLECQPGDIMAYVRNEKEDHRDVERV